jgi:hypothetical protein
MAGTWTQLKNAPSFPASTMLLLTDGTVMCQQSGAKNWFKLTPDAQGDYVNGTWSTLSAMPNAPLYFASAVLNDGRVFCAGGEYNNFVPGADLLAAEIYDPLVDTWTVLGTPPGWAKIGDAPCCVLPDGRLLLGAIDTTNTAIYDPVANSWTDAGANGAKNDASSEETWTLLPDGSVLTAECINFGKAEKYIPSQDKWVSAGSTPVSLVQPCPGFVGEIGPAVLLPNGKVFAIGATGHTALYTPPAVSTQPGTWAKGPDFKDANGKTLYAMDAPCCLLPNGKVLCIAGPDPVCSYPAPTTFLEYDGTNLNIITGPSNASGRPYVGRMLLLPTGQVLFAAATNVIAVYTPDGAPKSAWRPVITSCPNHLLNGQTYTLSGKQLNGLSQACSYGDDATMATNYPIVKLKSNASGKVFYCRTHSFSTMAVATGPTVVSTDFTVVCVTETGPMTLTVIANGIESKPFAVTVDKAPVQKIQINEAAVAVLIGSLADGPLWVLGPNGPVPVDPWGPDVVKKAQAIRQQVMDAVQASRALGREVTRLHAEQLRNEPIQNLESTLKDHSGPAKARGKATR